MPITRLAALAAVCGLALAGTASAQYYDPDAQATLKNADGEVVGVAELKQGPKALVITTNVEGMPQGWHAIHIHQTGDCSDPQAGFKASGGHLGVDSADHGFLSEGGPHPGDLPNIFMDPQGNAQQQTMTTLASLNGEAGMALFDDDGAAIVIHSDPDDHMTDPAGGGGPRLACGVVEKLQG